MRFRTVLLALALAGAMAAQGAVQFKNFRAIWSVGDDACVESLVEQLTNRELVKEKVPFVGYVDSKGGEISKRAGGHGGIVFEVGSTKLGWSARKAEVPVDACGGRAVVRVGPAYRTVWYEIVL